MTRSRLQISFAIAALMISTSLAAAAGITFDVHNTGGNNFEYEYTVTGAFQQFEDFEITFARTLYSFPMGYQPAAPNADWMTLLLPPDPSIPADGIYIAEAGAGNPSLADKFIVDFQFLGNGVPGSQPFAINQFDLSGDFVGIQQTGRTMPDPTIDTPEPGSFLLLMMSIVGFVLCCLCGPRLSPANPNSNSNYKKCWTS